MTTDELVAKVIDTLQTGTDPFQWDMVDHVRRVVTEHDHAVYSVALNDETKDVRYVMNSWRGERYETFEVFPHTVVRTEYRKVK